MEDFIIEKLDGIKKTLNIIDRYLGEFNYSPFVFVISLSHFIDLFWAKEFAFFGIFVGVVYDGLHYQCVRSAAIFFFIERGKIREIKGTIFVILSLVTSGLSSWFHILYYDKQIEYGAMWPIALGVFAWFNVINSTKNENRACEANEKELSKEEKENIELLKEILPGYTSPGEVNSGNSKPLQPKNDSDSGNGSSKKSIPACPYCGQSDFLSVYKRNGHMQWCPDNPNGKKKSSRI